MKSVRFMLPMVLLSIAVAASAQHAGAPVAPSSAQKSFAIMKSLAGNWEGPVTTDPSDSQMSGAKVDVTMRITSRGNALVHEMQDAGTPLDPAKYDHPVTVFYLDGGRLFLTHYCDAGNRPRMVAHLSPDGKNVVFDFVSLSGGNENGHMYHAVFTIIDSNRHTEDWTYLEPGNKPIRAHVDLQRVN